MTKHDVIRSTAAHIRRVGDLLVEQSHALMKRAVHHDSSKWSVAEYPYFEEATPRLADLVYGSEEYRQQMIAIKPAIKHHQATNSHHPEHYPNGISDMDLLDLVEMLCDWKAAGERQVDGDILRSLEINKERFGIDDQLYNVLRTTAIRWFNLPPD